MSGRHHPNSPARHTQPITKWQNVGKDNSSGIDGNRSAVVGGNLLVRVRGMWSLTSAPMGGLTDVPFHPAGHVLQRPQKMGLHLPNVCATLSRCCGRPAAAVACLRANVSFPLSNRGFRTFSVPPRPQLRVSLPHASPNATARVIFSPAPAGERSRGKRSGRAVSESLGRCRRGQRQRTRRRVCLRERQRE